MISVLTFIFVVVVTAILFGLWVVVTIGKLIWNSLSGKPRQPMMTGAGRPCMNPGCRASNPVHARYCRRCGSDLAEVAQMRRMNQPQPRFNPTNGRGRQAMRV
jgi:hypothetical protein